MEVVSVNNLYDELNIDEKSRKTVEQAELECQEIFKKIDEDCNINSLRVLSSFHKNNISEGHFNETTGYGYNDFGRDAIENVFKDILHAEKALVRSVTLQLVDF